MYTFVARYLNSNRFQSVFNTLPLRRQPLPLRASRWETKTASRNTYLTPHIDGDRMDEMCLPHNEETFGYHV